MLARACRGHLGGPAHHHRRRASTASRERSRPTGQYCHRSRDPPLCASTTRAHALTRRPPTAASAPQTSLLTSDKVQQLSSLRSRHTRRRTGRTCPRPRPRCHSSRTRAARTDPSIAIATPGTSPLALAALPLPLHRLLVALALGLRAFVRVPAHVPPLHRARRRRPRDGEVDDVADAAEVRQCRAGGGPCRRWSLSPEPWPSRKKRKKRLNVSC